MKITKEDLTKLIKDKLETSFKDQDGCTRYVVSSDALAKFLVENDIVKSE